MPKFQVYRGNRYLGFVFGYASDDAKLSKAKATARAKYGAGVCLKTA